MGGPQGDSACQQMLWVHNWGSASGTGHLHTGWSVDLAAGSRETPRGDRDCSEMGWLRAPDEGMCDLQRLQHHQHLPICHTVVDSEIVRGTFKTLLKCTFHNS